jgi:hypothetical protein
MQLNPMLGVGQSQSDYRHQSYFSGAMYFNKARLKKYQLFVRS